MEKLIELLNEFDKLENSFTHYKKGWYGDCVYENYLPSISHLILISKSYGFIWWLVENDKIDLEELDKSERKPMYSFEEEGKLGFKLFGVYESLLMLLSIQDNPIEFLVKILK